MIAAARGSPLSATARDAGLGLAVVVGGEMGDRVFEACGVHQRRCEQKYEGEQNNGEAISQAMHCEMFPAEKWEGGTRRPPVLARASSGAKPTTSSRL